ncbi:hypothetical protein Hanom_Chr17g01571201 [Helianthus anomalus]
MARKYDKLGKHFGFVSFVNVRDPVELENQMRDVWIGSYKLFIFLARFVDGERLLRKGEKQWVPVRNDEEDLATGKGDRNMDYVEEMVNVGKGLGEGRTFRDTVLNVDPPKKVPEIVVSADFKGGLLWDGYLVGQAKVGIRYLGGFWFMLLFESEICMEGFVRTKEVWKVCFDSLVRWEGQLIHMERIAWLKLYGIPLSFYDIGLFNEVDGKFGTIVQQAELNESVVDLSYVMIGKEGEFSVVVEDEKGEWIPDCLEDYSAYSEDTSNPAVGKDEEDDMGNEQTTVVEAPTVVEDVEQEDGELNNVSGLDTGGVNLGVMSNRAKKAKGFRKKARTQKSPSPPGQERPKKRAREGEDLFDLDRFIYDINGDEVASVPSSVKAFNREDSVSSVDIGLK